MVPVRAPRVNDKRVDEESGERKRFSSRSCQRTPGAEGQRRDPGAVPVGLSTGDFRPALEQLLGEDARRLCAEWEAEHGTFSQRELLSLLRLLVRRWLPRACASARTLSAFYDFPAEHWRHLRTSNAIESSFATVKLRTRATKGAGSKKAALSMAYKLLDAAQGMLAQAQRPRARRRRAHRRNVQARNPHRRRQPQQRDDTREGRRLKSFTPSSTTFDNCSVRVARRSAVRPKAAFSERRSSPKLDSRGAIAQLGERLLCKQEVTGSIPVGSM